MAKKVTGYIKLQIPAGKATPAPPVGPALGQHGVNIEDRLDKTNMIHVPVGKASFTEEQLADNFQTLMDAINKAKPATLKGAYIKSATLTSTMGPGVKLNVVKLVQ